MRWTLVGIKPTTTMFYRVNVTVIVLESGRDSRARYDKPGQGGLEQSDAEDLSASIQVSSDFTLL